MIHQFHKFFEFIFGGFLKFGPAVLRKASRRVKFPKKQKFEEIQGFSKLLSIAWTA